MACLLGCRFRFDGPKSYKEEINGSGQGRARVPLLRSPNDQTGALAHRHLFGTFKSANGGSDEVAQAEARGKPGPRRELLSDDPVKDSNRS
jgi:hypothetical protein